MAILKRRLNYNNADGSADTLHLETSSDMVVRSDGGSVETKLQSLDTDLQAIPAQIEEKATQIVSSIVSDSPEAFRTLKAFYDWTQDHETDAAEMLSKINNLLTRVAVLEAHKAAFGLIDIT